MNASYTSDPLFISGSMFASKSKMLMDFIEVAHKDNMMKYLVFKPTRDTRDGLYIQSRVYQRVVPALAWDQNYEDMQAIFSYTVAGFALTNPDEFKFIFIDEVHFMSQYDVEFIAYTCKKYGVSVVFAGLETSFKQEYFESTKWLKDNFTTIFLNGNCNGCGEKNAVYNVLYDQDGNVVKEGQDIQPGNEEYKVFCEKCMKEL
jgi:thymidine kinase